MSRYDDAHEIVTGQQADVAVGMIRELYRDVPGPDVFGELNELFLMAVALSYDVEVVGLITRCFHTLYRERMTGALAAETHAAAWTACELTVIDGYREPEGYASLIAAFRLPRERVHAGYSLFQYLWPLDMEEMVVLRDWVMTMIAAALEAQVIDEQGAGDCRESLIRGLREEGAKHVADPGAEIARVRQRFGHLPATPVL